MELGDVSALPGGGGIAELEVGLLGGVQLSSPVVEGGWEIGEATGHYLSCGQVAPKEKEEEWWSKVEAKPTDRRAVRPIAPPVLIGRSFLP
jgi:hypothetical protein